MVRVRARVAAIWIAGVLAALLATGSPASGQTSTPCGLAPEGYNVIVSDAAEIVGSDGDDFICAGGSGNRILAGAGHDIIRAGDGVNTIFGQSGNDRIHGGPQRDRIMAGAGDDLVFGNGGRDLIRGGQGDDVLSGGQGRDRVFGQVGDDVLRGNGGPDILTGGDGSDRTDGGRSKDRCVDTLYVKRCDEIVGAISVLAGFDAEPKWWISDNSQRDFAYSDDGRFVVFVGLPQGTTDRLQVVVRDILEDEFTVIGQSRRKRRPGLCGLDISGDGQVVAFASGDHGLIDDPDEIGGFRIFLVDVASGERTLVPRPVDDTDGVCLPQLSTDGSIVMYKLTAGLDEAESLVDAQSIVRHDLTRSPEFVDRYEGRHDFTMWEPRLSGDGSTIAFQTENSDFPEERNGLGLDVNIREEDGSTFLAFTDLVDEFRRFRGAGLSEDGRIVATQVIRAGPYAKAFAFQNLDTMTSTIVRGVELCATCEFNEAVFANDWAAVNVLHVADGSTEDGGILLLTPDGRRQLLEPTSDVVGTLEQISPDGRIIGFWTWEDDPYRMVFRNPADL